MGNIDVTVALIIWFAKIINYLTLHLKCFVTIVDMSIN